MENNTFKDVRTSQELLDASKLASTLKNDPMIQKVLTHNHISMSELDSHPFTVKRWFDSYSPCIGCKGLDTCKQKKKGYFDNLVSDGFLHTEKKACKYTLEHLESTKHIQNYLVNDLPEDLYTVAFSTIDMSNESKEYATVVTEAYQQCEQSKGLYLYGDMGTGKTYLSACACNYYAKEGKKVAFIHYPSFTQRMASTVSEGEYKNELSKLKYAYFLVIDDIGAESVTEWNRDGILLPLLNERYEKHLPTWFTSNETLETLQEHFEYTSKGKEEKTKSSRILERIKSMAKPLSLKGESRRVYQ